MIIFRLQKILKDNLFMIKPVFSRFCIAANFFKSFYRVMIGPGFQIKVSTQANISAPYLNYILQGKKKGSKKIRKKIVFAISKLLKDTDIDELTYDNFIEFGEFLIEHYPRTDSQKIIFEPTEDLIEWLEKFQTGKRYKPDNSEENKNDLGNKIDTDLLYKIIINIEEGIKKENINISARKKAQLITYLYDEITKINLDELEYQNKIQTILKLVG